MEPDILPVLDATHFTAVLPASTRLPEPPRFSFGDFPAPVAAAYYRATHLHGVGVYAANGLAWCRGFVLGPDGALLRDGSIQIHQETIDRLGPQGRTALRAAAPERLSGVAAALVPPGDAYRIYGHWLVDILPKLAVLVAAGHDLAQLWYPVPADTPDFALDLMRLFGVPEDRIVAVASASRLTPDRLLIPTSLHNGVRMSPLLREAAALFRSNLRRAATLPTGSQEFRIFLARKGRNRMLTNRTRIENMARAAGFAVIYPETRTLPEQVALFAGAREIVGEYGSAFHTALFAPAGTVVCGLRGDQLHPGFIQSGLGEELEQPTGYVFGSGAGTAYDYAIAEDAFAECLKTVFDRQAGLATAVPKPAPHVPPAAPAVPTETTRRRATLADSLLALFRGRRSQRPTRGSAVAGGRDVNSPATQALTLLVIAHVQTRGDTPADPDGWAGAPGSGLALEGFQIGVTPERLASGLTYQAILPDASTSARVEAGRYCGTRGQNIPILGLVMHADARIAAAASITIEARFLDGSHFGPSPAGVPCRSETSSPLEAFRLTVVRDTRPPGLHSLLSR